MLVIPMWEHALLVAFWWKPWSTLLLFVGGRWVGYDNIVGNESQNMILGELKGISECAFPLDREHIYATVQYILVPT